MPNTNDKEFVTYACYRTYFYFLYGWRTSAYVPGIMISFIQIPTEYYLRYILPNLFIIQGSLNLIVTSASD
jgi:hypothetical protein